MSFDLGMNDMVRQLEHTRARLAATAESVARVSESAAAVLEQAASRGDAERRLALAAWHHDIARAERRNAVALRESRPDLLLPIPPVPDLRPAAGSGNPPPDRLGHMLHLSQDEAADQLLSDDPLALLIGMVLDQQIPLEKAFRSPLDLKERLGGGLDAGRIAAMDPDALAKVFATPPALHRFPGSMAARVQELCRVVSEELGGDASAVWSSASDGQALFRAVKALPGFGEQKARIFVALLGKQLGVRPPGWREAAGAFGEEGSLRSIADIDGPETLAQVRAYKKEMKARAKAEAGDGAAQPAGKRV